MSYTDFNSDDFVFFVLDKAHHRNASFGFRAAYYDVEGNFHTLTVPQIDKSTGEKMIRKFKIQKGHKTLRVRKNQTEIIEFLRNHPNCKDSPNASYRYTGDGGKEQVDIWFFELNTSKDAEKAVDVRITRLEAQNRILALAEDSVAIIEFGNAIGYNGDEKIVLFNLLEHAEKDPDFILAELDSPTMKAKALFNEALGEKVIGRKGVMFMVGDFELGVDDDSAIKAIVASPDITTLIKKKLGKEEKVEDKKTSSKK